MAIRKIENTASKYAAVSSKNDDILEERAAAKPMLFNRQNFIYFGVGLLTVIVGFLFMAGGQMPDANTFDESIIYSPMRITVAPFLVLVGLGIVIYGIFKNTDAKDDANIL
jgi:hypothetical protein